MKHTHKTFTLLIVLMFLATVVFWASWPARHVQAIQDSEDFPPPFGLAQGQTARLTLFNSGDTAAVGPEYRFVNHRGEILAGEDRIVVLPGQFRSFDFDLPNPPPGTPVDPFGRIQLRVEVLNPDTKNLHVSVEIFENVSGRTTVVLSPRPDPD